MNKSQLIEALSARYEGNKKAAQHALESVLDTITREIAKGEKVAITGFGSFEKRVRAARTVMNPQTKEKMRARRTYVAKFSPGAELKDIVAGKRKLPKLTLPKPGAKPAAKKAAAAPAKKTAAKKAAAKKAPAKKTTAKKTAAKKAPAKKTAAKKTTAKKAPAKKTAAKKAPAKKTAAKKAPAKKTAAKKSTAKKAAKKS